MITHPVNRGFAGGCNSGAAVADHDTVIFLNNDTVPTGSWIDPLVAALSDATVAAAGPRSNCAPDDQLAEGGGYGADMRAMRRFARDWSRSHRAEHSDVAGLDGFCVAVRRTAWEQVGGFDEGYGTGGLADDDFCRRLTDAGHRLVVCDDSYVHHTGRATYEANGLDWLVEQDSNRSRYAAAHPGSAGAPGLRIGLPHHQGRGSQPA